MRPNTNVIEIVGDVAYIHMLHGKVAIIDAEDVDRVKQYCWYTGNKTSLRVGNKYMGLLHRFILGLKKGDGKEVDHINQNPLDNRKCNLRLVTRSQNMMNRTAIRNNTIGFKGVNFSDRCKLPYRAYIRKDGICYRLGRYATAIEAARAYDKKAIELFGEYACPNFPL
jgi:hypothetical protein